MAGVFVGVRRNWISEAVREITHYGKVPVSLISIDASRRCAQDGLNKPFFSLARPAQVDEERKKGMIREGERGGGGGRGEAE